MVEVIAVMGGGAGGLTTAGDLALAGNTVNLFELPMFQDALKPVVARGGVEVKGEGVRQGFARLNKITFEAAEAMKDAEIIILAIPCFGHRTFAEKCAPNLEDGQLVMFIGEGGGATVFRRVMKENKNKTKVVVGEANTLPYLTRITGLGEVTAKVKIGGVLAAALPASDNVKLLQTIRGFWPFIQPAENVLETVLLNFNAIDHVATFILNLGRIEGTTGDMPFWGEGATPSVARCIEAVDKEILAIRTKLGLKNRATYIDWLVRQGLLDSPKTSYHEAIHASRLEKSMFKCAPDAAKHRYITEDVPYALVLISSIGDYVKTETPVIDALITLASAFNQTDYRLEGRTLTKLGIRKKGVRDLRAIFEKPARI